MDELTAIPDAKTRQEIKDSYKVHYVDIKFHSVQERDEEEQSEFTPTEDVFQITDSLIEKYVEENNTQLDKKSIMEGLEILKDEESC